MAYIHVITAILGYGSAYLVAKRLIKVPLKQENNRLTQLSPRYSLHYIQMKVSLVYSHLMVLAGILWLIIEGLDTSKPSTVGQQFIAYHSIGFLIYDSLLTYLENINIMFVYIHHAMTFIAISSTILSDKGLWITAFTLACSEVSHYWHVQNEIYKLINFSQKTKEYRRNFLIYFVIYSLARGVGVTWIIFLVWGDINIPFIFPLFSWPIPTFNYLMIYAMYKKAMKMKVSDLTILPSKENTKDEDEKKDLHELIAPKTSTKLKDNGFMNQKTSEMVFKATLVVFCSSCLLYGYYVRNFIN